MHERQRIRVYVKGRDWALESALARTLAQNLGETAAIEIGEPEPMVGRRDIVVTTDDVASLEDVADLTQRGEQVVVLAALPSDAAESTYRRAGAQAYLPMIAPAAPLIAAVTGLILSLSQAF